MILNLSSDIFSEREIKLLISPHSLPKERRSTEFNRVAMLTPARAKNSADIEENGNGSSNTTSAPAFIAALARVYLSAMVN